MIGIYMAMLDTDEEKEKFERLYITYRDVMYNFAYMILKDKYRAEDAVHDAFIAVTKRLDTIPEDDSSKTRNYMITITRNAAFKIYNISKVEVSVEDVLEEEPDLSIIDEDIESNDLHRKIIRIIKSLEYKYSSVIILKFYFGMKDKEIADFLEITPQNARVRLMRAKNLVKQMLLDEKENDE